jgi:hypothetical protein
MTHDRIDDRRQAPRVEVSTSAIVLARHNNGVAFVIESMSTSGARLAGPLTLGVGERVQILFEIDGHPIDVCAEVVRVEKFDMMTDRVAVTFRDVDAETQKRIVQLVQQTLRLEQERLGAAARNAR